MSFTRVGNHDDEESIIFYDPNDFTDIYDIHDIHDIYNDDYTNNGGDKS